MYIFIPIPLNTSDEIKYYHYYPDAPEATRKAQTFVFLAQTSWAFFLSWYMFFCIFTVFCFYDAISIYDNSGRAFLLVGAIGISIFYLVRKRAWRTLNEQARIEAEKNKYVAKYLVQAQFDELDRELRKKRQRSEGVFLIFMGLLFGFFLAWLTISEFTPDEVKDISKSSGSELTDGTYYIEKLMVLDKYAEAEKGQPYYIAVFNDVNSKPNFISFTPYAKAHTMLNGYMNDESAAPLTLSVYAKIGSISSEGEQYSGFNSLYNYYHKACSTYSEALNVNIDVTDKHAKYICMGDEDIRAAQAPGLLFFLGFAILLAFVSLFLFLGVSSLKKSMTA